ncbi:MAG: diguanylate cyclase domain-containing protein, partial [Gemmatimonadota bacterium]
RRADGRELIGELSTVAVDDGDRVCYEGIIRDVTEERQARAEWERRALHDGLTGLPDRTLFWDRLEHAIDRAERRGGLLGVLFVDVDGFKAINDRHGHPFGDEVLREMAERLQAVLRDEDTIARYGGDEFTVLLERVGEPEDVERAVRRLRDAAGAISSTPEGDRPVTISVGTALFEPEPAGDRPSTAEQARELVAEADRAMYEDKRSDVEGSPRAREAAADSDSDAGVPPAVTDPNRLTALRRSGLLEDTEEPTFDRITDLAAPVAFVSLVDEDRQVFKSSCGFPEPWASAGETPLELSYCQHTVDRREPFAVEDARSHPIVRDSRAIEELEAIAYLGVPLITESG